MNAPPLASLPGASVLTLAAGEPLVLISWWKPLLLILPLIGYLWLVSRIFDKHAARFHLGRTTWNAVLLAIAAIGFAGSLALPVASQAAYWAGLGIMVAMYVAGVTAFVVVTNRDERVPEGHRLKLDLSTFAEARQARAQAKLQGKVELSIKNPSGELVAAPETDSPEYQVRIAAESLFLRGLEFRASLIELGPTGKDGAYGTSMLVDGVRQAGELLPAQTAVPVIDFWKRAAGMDPADRRRRLSADIRVERGTERHTLRIGASGAQGGMRLSLLVDPEKAVRVPADDLGLLEAQAAELRAIVEDRRGVVLLAGPAQGGRTTTMYAAVKMHDAYTSNVQTLELQPQDTLEGVRQNRFDPAAEGPEFSTTIRSILRRDPDVVAVAELPDAATAREVARSDHERTRVYVSMRGESALGAIQTWVSAVGDPAQAATALHGVLVQRLLRKLCINCRVPYQPAPDMLARLGLPADKVRQLHKKGGQVLIKNRPEVCPVCGGSGYIGQTGIFEVFALGDAERALIRAGNLAGLRAELRKRMLPTIQQAAIRRAVEGITSVEEVMRVTAERGAGAQGA